MNGQRFPGRYRRGVLYGGTLIGVLAVCIGTSVPAWAALTSPANNIVVGSGSASTYPMNVALDNLFNGSAGCNTVAPSGTSQQLDFSCVAGQTLTPGQTENPINDVGTVEPPLGSSSGITQLEDQGAHGGSATVNVADNINYATSLRAPKSSDLQGLNFVAYAKDGIAWFHFTGIGGTATPSANVASLSQSQLQGIYNGTITNWSQVGGTSAPIDPYTAPSTAGVRSDFDSFLGFSSSTYISSLTSYNGYTNYAASHVITQNEDAQILSDTDPGTGKSDAVDALYFFSVGNYTVSCKKTTNCGGSPLPTGDTNGIGELNGVKPTKTTVLNGTYPLPVYAYNVYSNGSNSNIPVATQATLNLVSEDGFICKPNTSNGTPIIDPVTGVAYQAEIDSIITADGFFPLKLGSEGTVAHPAVLTPSGPYAANDSSGTNPKGYCLVTTTDGNAGS